MRSSIVALFILAFVNEALGVGSGEFIWDARWNPESSNNMCYSMYCLNRGEIITHANPYSDKKTAGDIRRDMGNQSGQRANPVGQHTAYGLNFPSMRQTLDLMFEGAMTTITQNLIVADEWPPATALEGGQGASIRATTRKDSNIQGAKIKQMWKERDSNNRVHVKVTNYDWTDTRYTVDAYYCKCKNLQGKALRDCCENDGYQFQKDPDPNTGPGRKARFFFNDLDNYVKPRPGPFKKLLVGATPDSLNKTRPDVHGGPKWRNHTMSQDVAKIQQSSKNFTVTINSTLSLDKNSRTRVEWTA